MTAKSRVLFLTPYAIPHIGGISTFVCNLAVALEDGASWDCWTVARWGGRSERQVGSESLVGFLFLTLVHIWTRRPLVVHAHAHWYTLLVPIILRELGLEFRLLFTFHTMLPAQSRIRRRAILEWVISQCDLVTFVSSALERQISSELTIRTQIATLYPGVRLPKESPHLPHETSLKSVGFAGPLVWTDKVAGLDLLIQALGLIRLEVPDAELLLAGSGRYLADLQERARALQVSDSVHFLGNLNSLDEFWSSISIYAQISLQEGLPLSLLEAMARGKPVVATPVGGVVEVIEDGKNGLLVSPEPAAIASAIKTIFQDATLGRRLGAAARRTVDDRFDLESLAGRATALYEESTAATRGRAGG